MSLPRSRSGAALLTAASTLVLLAGCGTETSPATGGNESTAPSDHTTSAEPEQTETASAPVTSEPDTDASLPTPSESGVSLRERLLPADELPGVNQETVWKATSTGPEKGATPGSCQRFPLVDIGADNAVVRAYAGGEGVRAVQVVAAFADPKSAWRAAEVLTTWSRGCAEHLDVDVEKVGRLTPATVEGGSGASQLVQHGDEGAELHTFAGIALVRQGRFLSFVEIDVESSDYNYEPGQEPAMLAVPLMAERLS